MSADPISRSPGSAVKRLKKAISNDFMDYIGGHASFSSLSRCVNDSAGDTTFAQTYEKNGVLGEGGLAIVYRCRHNTNQSYYAVKEILQSSYEEHGEVNIKDEISALKLLRDSPYIVRLLGVFHKPDRTFMVMEELRGGDLLNRITEQGAFSEKDSRSICRTLLEALGYCHRKGIAHRDVKPENILLVDEINSNKIKLADFGCSQRISGPDCFRTLCGTALYAAPEMLLSSNGYDERCDLWSAGVVIYILLGGYSPFEGEAGDIPDIVCEGQFEFHEDSWWHITEPPKELIRSLLELYVEQRATVTEALDSNWLCRRDKKKTNSSISTSTFNNSYASVCSTDSCVSTDFADLDGFFDSLNLDDL